MALSLASSLNKGLVGHWSLSKASAVIDGYTTFDGVDDLVTISSFQTFSGDVTIAGWYKHDTFAIHLPTSIAQDGTKYFPFLRFEDTTTIGFLWYSGSWQQTNVTHGMSTGQWYNIVGTVNGTTSKIYINSSLMITATKTAPVATASVDMHIGKQTQDNKFTDGDAADVRIYNKELSASQVSDLYNGVNVTDGLVSRWPLVDDYNDHWGSNNGTNSGSVQRKNYPIIVRDLSKNSNNGVNVKGALPVGGTVEKLGPELLTNTTFDNITGWAPGGGNTNNPDADSGTLRYRDGGYAHGNGNLFGITVGHVYKVTFEVTEVTNALTGVRTVFRSSGGNDLSGNFLAVVGTQTDYFVALETVTNASILLYAYGTADLEMRVDNPSVKEVLDHTSTALEFDGTNDYISAGSMGPIAVPFTLSAWINPTTTTDYDRIIGSSDGSNYRYLGFKTNKLASGKNSGGWVETEGSGTVTTGAWSHVALVDDGTDTLLYLNGSLDATLSSHSFNLETNVYLGVNGSVSGNYFDGKLADVRIYDRALTADEVSQLYRSRRSVAIV